MGEQTYIQVEIDTLKIYGEGLSIELYIKLSDEKFIKISHHGDQVCDLLEKYDDRGVRNLYLTPDAYKKFIDAVKELMSIQKRDKEGKKIEYQPEERAQRLSAAHSVLKDIFNTSGINEDSKQIAKSLTQQSINLIDSTNIFDKMKEFKQNCSEEYLHAVMTSYIASLMLDKFSWSTDAIKEKVVMGAILCDITLTPDNFKELKEKKSNVKTLSDKVLNHPWEVSKQLESSSRFVEHETLQIIQQHHERPNGKGFPKGIGYNSITILTSIFIIANYFVERMFDLDEKEPDLPPQEKTNKVMAQVPEKFYSGNFRKASDALISIMGSGKE